MGTSPQQIPTFEPSWYSKLENVFSIMKDYPNDGQCLVVVKDDVAVTLSIRGAVLNMLAWQVLFEYGLMPTESDVIVFKSITSDTFAKVHSKIYERLLDEFPNIDDEWFNRTESDPYAMPNMTISKDDFKPKGHMKFVMSLAKNLNLIENFTKLYLSGYWASIDGLGLAKLVTSPDFEDILNKKCDSNLGTLVAEKQIKERSVELLKRLKNPNIPNNCLYPYMAAGILKTNQISQNIMQYGTRSDIDDSMMKNVINESAFHGLDNTTDFAIEALSAKKSTYLLTNLTSDSQYLGRKLKLSSAPQPMLYRNSCGSDLTIPYVFDPKWADRDAYMGKIIMDKNMPVVITKNNIEKYIGKTVNMISPFTCKHGDGICERCAGYGEGRLISYLPLGIHLGIYCAMKLVEAVTQKVLSAKHLISTKSVVYELTGNVTNYMVRNGDKIYWNDKVKSNLDQLSVLIPADAMNPVVDLGFKDVIPVPATFSKVSYWRLLKNGEPVDMIQMEQDNVLPFMSEDFLRYMHEHYNELQLDDEGVIVPLKHFDPKLSVFQYVVMNDDMVSYTKRINDFTSNKITTYHDVSIALRDFAAIMYSKSDLPLFYLEVVLRNFLVKDNFQIPQVVDPQHVNFVGLHDVITDSTVSMKFAFEKLKAYLDSPETTIKVKPAGLYSFYFGLL